MPAYSKGIDDPYSMDTTEADDDVFKEYLLFNTVLELGSSHRKNQPNLEDVGLLKVSYKKLDQIARNKEMWQDIPEFLELSEDAREDYLTGYLDIMRYRNAVDYAYLRKPGDFEKTIVSKLEEDVLFHDDLKTIPSGYSDQANKRRGVNVYRLSSHLSPFVSWTVKVLSTDKERAREIVRYVASKLESKGGLKRVEIKYVGNLLMINPKAILLSLPSDVEHKVCKKCGLVHHFKEVNFCTGNKCQELIIKNLSNNYFRMEYARGFDEVVPLNAAEHSGQIDGETRKEIETRFKNPQDTLNTIVCTPTMELGIDIGALSAVYMRNVPPSPSNYAQRAGRAGRKSQASIINTFCGVGSKRGPHDQYFYRYPDKIISGEISTPRFLLNNKSLVTAHIHSLVLEIIGTKVPQKIEEIIELEDDALPLKTDLVNDLQRAIQKNKQEILEAINESFEGERNTFGWFDNDFIGNTVDNFVKDMDDSFEFYRKEFSQLKRELYQLNVQGERKGLTSDKEGRRKAIEGKLKDMREGGKDYFSYRYLASQGFTPNYGFPTHVSTLMLDHRMKRDIRETEMRRDRLIAVSEYAPGNSVYYSGGRYVIKETRAKTLNNRPITKRLLICPMCGAYYIGDDVATTGGACKVCGALLEEEHPFENAVEMPDQFAIRRHSVTSDEEERMRLGYKLSEHYHRGTDVDVLEVMDDTTVLRLCYEHNGRILRVNTGTRKTERDNQENGFTLCTACNRWLFGEDDVKKHLDQKNKKSGCWRNATEEDIIRDIVLYTETSHDVVTVDCELPEDIEENRAIDFYYTLAQAIIQGLQISMNIDVDEVRMFLMGDHTIVVYETAEGGTGALAALRDRAVLHQVAHSAREILHEFDPEDKQCERACYECLCNYYNQSIHNNLDRKLVLPTLARLERADVKKVSREPSKEDYEHLKEQCDSEFEKEVLKSIYEHGMPLPTAQKTIYDADEPIAVVDFYYDKGHIVVFVDGPDHNKDYVVDSDQKKRERLDTMGYRVFVVRYDDDLEQRIAELGKMLGL
ncbi:MAG: helicase-related protein [Methermicoccaceae archaeon]